jgi:site-specific recombinase XerD
MLETYFAAPKTLARLRAGPSGAYIDGFAAALEQDGYCHAAAQRYLRAAAHLGHFLERQGGRLADIDGSTAGAFFRHMATCRCPLSNGGKLNHHPYFGAQRYRAYLVQIGICQDSLTINVWNPEPARLVGFRQWLRRHRGAAESTIRQYSRGAAALMSALGDEPMQWDAKQVRKYFLERASQCGVNTVQKLATSLRAFLRYLSVYGQCQADLDHAVPAVASWRLADLPRSLTAVQVDRLIAACDGDSPKRRRDRAIILLLARLGLRAGDVARLRVNDLEWATGTLRVSGKGRYQVRLPLPQDVGDAIIDYLECRPKSCESDSVFLRNIAPFRPFVRGDGVSSVVRSAMRRAGLMTPAKGAHILRHTAATEMLRSIDTTAYYAKADVNLLKQIAQPWPEVLP